MKRRTFLKSSIAAALLHGVGARPSASDVSEPQVGNGATILTNATLLDGMRAEPQRGMTLVLVGGRVVRVSARAPTYSELRGSRVIDAEGLHLLPGLCDAHSHLINPFHVSRETRNDSYIRMGSAAIDALQKGVTSLRVLGAPDYSDVAWRKAFSQGLFLGPRIVATGHTLVPTAGHGASHNYGQIHVADGADAVRRAVREQIQNDVDQIKLVGSGGVFGDRWDNSDHSHYTVAEVEAACATAAQRGVKVAIHATNPTSVKRAVLAGAHTVEHGYLLDEECIELMRDRRTILVPTLCVTHLTPFSATTMFERDYLKRWPMPDYLFARADARREAHLAGLTAALNAGVRIASGPDHSPPAETVFLEIELLVRAGLSPMQAIMAATRVAAEAAGIESEVGTVEVGKQADLLLVAGNPLESISDLRRTVIVIKQGNIVVDRRTELGYVHTSSWLSDDEESLAVSV